MKLILLSGGSGKRLWPLSNDSRSKQFLKVLEDGEGGRQSMVQRVWQQLGRAGLQREACLATSRAQVEMLQSQLGSGVEIIVEPQRRDTFPAIALSAVYLYSIKGVALQETIVVLPVDPYVEDHFFGKLQELEQIMGETEAEIGLIGVQPTYPSEKYGYIVPEPGSGKTAQSSAEYARVSRFTEKPREEQARELISQQALWNCGVFAFRLGYVINELIRRGLPIQYDELVKQYERLEETSFDYAVVEKAEHIVVTPYQGTWKDLGTWNTLTEEIRSPLVGKGIVTEDSLHTHVINELDIPITVLGASNLIVAASPDGILVSDKEASPRVKEVMKKLEDQRPMYEERRWGRYRVLDYVKYPEGYEVLTKRICVSKGCNLSYQYHSKRSEVWTVIAGEGEMVLGGELRRITAGDVVAIPVGTLHSLRALQEIEIIEVQTGSELIEEDIVRIAMKWEEIIQVCAS
ncbi:sugar phosphate nucleotidyltransferase [Paenibacillus tarimensis]|uniref:sugar phosphate nucleotidyltransferase n=1 Tax=Paenibacillus tarimensis TaxID=416012 RepID=UPI001F40BC7A|nr:sugar phosphate nucleotidyltransferase [Paenibacillus tarimensis]MCF2944229.1 cupin domain-containing protein [Paenibacillus tarimensis]